MQRGVVRQHLLQPDAGGVVEQCHLAHHQAFGALEQRPLFAVATVGFLQLFTVHVVHDVARELGHDVEAAIDDGFHGIRDRRVVWRCRR